MTKQDKMSDKTKEFEEIIEKGTIEQIQEFLQRDFHSIQHTKSFTVMIYRLRNEEWLRKQAIKAIEKIQAQLYTLRDSISAQPKEAHNDQTR
jgi:hypothetical protein